MALPAARFPDPPLSSLSFLPREQVQADRAPGGEACGENPPDRSPPQAGAPEPPPPDAPLPLRAPALPAPARAPALQQHRPHQPGAHPGPLRAPAAQHAGQLRLPPDEPAAGAQPPHALRASAAASVLSRPGASLVFCLWKVTAGKVHTLADPSPAHPPGPPRSPSPPHRPTPPANPGHPASAPPDSGRRKGAAVVWPVPLGPSGVVFLPREVGGMSALSPWGRRRRRGERSVALVPKPRRRLFPTLRPRYGAQACPILEESVSARSLLSGLGTLRHPPTPLRSALPPHEGFDPHPPPSPQLSLAVPVDAKTLWTVFPRRGAVLVLWKR